MSEAVHTIESSTSERSRGEPDLNSAIAEMLRSHAHPARISADCPAHRIGLRIGHWTERHSELDELLSGPVDLSPQEKGDRERDMEKARRAIELLKDAMSFAQPTSLAGALAQFLVGTSFLMDPIESDLDDDLKDRCFRAGLRCICAASRLLEQLGNVSREEFGTAYYLPKHLDWLSTALGGPIDAAVPPVGEDAPPQPASGPEPEHPYDLAACSMGGLARLYEALRAGSDLLSNRLGSNSYFSEPAQMYPHVEWAQDYTAAGRILDEEQTRIGRLGDAVVREMERRVPATEFEREQRLEILVIHDLRCNGYVEGPLLSEAVAFWGTK